MTSTILCPHCGNPVEITQALTVQIQEQVAKDVQKQHEQELQSLKKKTEEALRKEFTQKQEVELLDLQKQLKEKDIKVQEMQTFELKLREEKRKLEDQEKSLKLEVARTLDEERKKLEETVRKQSDEAHRLKELEKEKVITDLRKALEDAQRKASQGSQQLQGEVQELDLEETLKSAFIYDAITAIGKGVRGADIKQVVKTPLGNVCGVILWESKRTKAWSDEWVSKLKEDVRSEKANLALIVSTVLPAESVHGFGHKDGVVVCSYQLAIPVAEMMRQKLIEVAREKFISQNRGEKKEELYGYITSHEFRQQIEALVEVYTDMHQQILKERSAMERIWKTRESQVTKLFTSTAAIVGSMRGKIGPSLSPVKGLELAETSEETVPEKIPPIPHQFASEDPR